jgi:hypothetical protein
MNKHAITETVKSILLVIEITLASKPLRWRNGQSSYIRPEEK